MLTQDCMVTVLAQPSKSNSDVLGPWPEPHGEGKAASEQSGSVTQRRIMCSGETDRTELIFCGALFCGNSFTTITLLEPQTYVYLYFWAIEMVTKNKNQFYVIH